MLAAALVAAAWIEAEACDTAELIAATSEESDELIDEAFPGRVENVEATESKWLEVSVALLGALASASAIEVIEVEMDAVAPLTAPRSDTAGGVGFGPAARGVRAGTAVGGEPGTGANPCGPPFACA